VHQNLRIVLRREFEILEGRFSKPRTTAAWVFTRNRNGTWSQQDVKLGPTDAASPHAAGGILRRDFRRRKYG